MIDHGYITGTTFGPNVAEVPGVMYGVRSLRTFYDSTKDCFSLLLVLVVCTKRRYSNSGRRDVEPLGN
jgi:hypothetical protein